MKDKNLLIIGAGVYGAVAKEVAESMNCFNKISFADDVRKSAFNGDGVVGTSDDLKRLSLIYGNMIAAVGNPDVKLGMLEKIKACDSVKTASLISPLAYVSPSAEIMEGCIIEPMAVVHSLARISSGCIISAGAVINHASVCEERVHIDCNATVAGNTTVPVGTKVCSGEVFKNLK